MQYDDKKAANIANLVENTYLANYPWSNEITYDQGLPSSKIQLYKKNVELNPNQRLQGILMLTIF